MNILKKLPDYPETNYVAESKGDYIQIDLATPGYTASDITIESRENGIAVTGAPKKDIGEGRLVKGFTNFFALENPKKFDRANINAEIYNGILTIRVPVHEEFRSVKINIKQAEL
jgi:HSP20 family molecular chaperone IbpA